MSTIARGCVVQATAVFGPKARASDSHRLDDCARLSEGRYWPSRHVHLPRVPDILFIDGNKRAALTASNRWCDGDESGTLRGALAR